MTTLKESLVPEDEMFTLEELEQIVYKAYYFSPKTKEEEIKWFEQNLKNLKHGRVKLRS
jgi:hypothetical protein